jgi:hypothetical protein
MVDALGRHDGIAPPANLGALHAPTLARNGSSSTAGICFWCRIARRSGGCWSFCAALRLSLIDDETPDNGARWP